MSTRSDRSARAALLRCGAALGLVMGAAAAGAQQAPLPQVSQPVVQQVPARSAGMKLNDALGQLARNPQDLEALIAAGRASLELGDVAAAGQRCSNGWPISRAVGAQRRTMTTTTMMTAGHRFRSRAFWAGKTTSKHD